MAAVYNSSWLIVFGRTFSGIIWHNYATEIKANKVAWLHRRAQPKTVSYKLYTSDDYDENDDDLGRCMIMIMMK